MKKKELTSIAQIHSFISFIRNDMITMRNQIKCDEWIGITIENGQNRRIPLFPHHHHFTFVLYFNAGKR